MPARPLHAAWRRFDHPTLEWFVGPTDVVHGTNFVVPPTRRAGAVVTVHDLTAVRFPELCTPATLAFPDLVRRAARRGALVHTPSHAVAAEVVELLGLEEDRVRPVASGIPALPEVTDDQAQRVTSALVPPGVERYVLAVGTAEPRKDLPGLVAAFEELAPSRPGLGLVLAGPPGWGAGELAAAIAASPARGTVARLGWVDEVTLSSLVRRAAVLAYPSRYEGFGFPPLQAMALGVPVVTTATGALPEIAGPGSLLVPPGDPEALAAGLAEVLDHDERRHELVAAGRARAACFSWEACAEGLTALYDEARAARP